MKTSFKKTLIAASAGMAMMAAVGTASANSLLFPFFTTASGAQSVLSISGNGPTTSLATPSVLHYVYNYGPTCTHFDGLGKITPNDLMQHSIASTAAGGFGKAVGSDTSTPFYFPLPNSYGFLTVTNTTTPTAADITGDMAIVDPTTGLVTSYAGITNASATEGDYSTTVTDLKFNLSAYPAAMVNTSWFATVAGNMNAAITGNRNWTAAVDISNNGLVFDNDEHSFSGGVVKHVACSGTLVATDLMNSAQAAAVGPNGGLIHATATPDIVPIDLATGLVMAKIQTVLPVVGAPFAGKTFLHREQGAAF